MRGGALIPVRFLILLGHLCVVTTLIWEIHQSVQHCLPVGFHPNHFQTYRIQLLTFYSVTFALICIELLTFLTGLTMFSEFVAMISIGCHGLGVILLSNFILDNFYCGWYWSLFFFCSILPFLTDLSAAVTALCSMRW